MILSSFYRTSKNTFFALITIAFFLPKIWAATASFYNPYTVLAQLYLPTLVSPMEAEHRKDLELLKNITAKTGTLTSFDISQSRINPAEKLLLTYSILASSTSADYATPPIFLTKETLSGLGVFSATNAVPLFDAIDQTHTTFGKIQLQKMLLEPCTEGFLLEQRQLIIKQLIDNEALLNDLSTQLEKIKESEHILLWFWKLSSAPMIEELNKYTGPFLNNSPFMRQLWRFIAGHLDLTTLCLSGWGTGMMFWGSARYHHYQWLLIPGIVGVFTTMWCFINVLQGYRKTRSDMNTIHATMNTVATFTNACSSLGNLIEKNTHLRILFSDYALIKNNFPSEQGKQLTQLLGTSTFTSNPGVFRYQGRAQVAFQRFNELKDQMTKSWVALGQLDAYVSIAKLYKKQSLTTKKFCFPTYVDGNQGHVKIENAWLPGASSTTNPRTNVIAVLMAQSLGIAPAQSMSLTPFNTINSTMNLA